MCLHMFSYILQADDGIVVLAHNDLVAVFVC